MTLTSYNSLNSGPVKITRDEILEAVNKLKREQPWLHFVECQYRGELVKDMFKQIRSENKNDSMVTLFGINVIEREDIHDNTIRFIDNQGGVHEFIIK